MSINGVKQEGILSSILFCMYMDGVLTRLRQSGLGCYIGDTFFGALTYAHDISIIAPPPDLAQKMLVFAIVMPTCFLLLLMQKI